MRINFDGRFSDIQKALGAYQQQQPQASVGSLAPNAVHDSGNKSFISEFSEAQKIPETAQEIRGELKSPNLERASIDFSKFIHDEIPKTPVIVHTERMREPKAALSERVEEIQKLVHKAGEKHGIDPALGLAVVSAESSFNPKAVSVDGFESKGLFQILDKTAQTQLSRVDESLSSYDPFDPADNVDVGVGYLRYLHEVFSKETDLHNKLKTFPAANSSSLEKLAVAAFNAGEGRVAYAQGRAQSKGKDPTIFENIKPYLPDITQRYVEKVLNERDKFGKANSTPSISKTNLLG